MGHSALRVSLQAQSIRRLFFEALEPPPSVTIYQGSKYTSADLSVRITNDPTRVSLTPENNLNFRQRQLFTTTVATFTAPSSDDTPADYTATIDWGDGTKTQGVITEQYDGTFDISGTMGYVHNSGSLTMKITVTDSSGRSIFCYSSIYLDPDPVEITPGTPTISTGTVSGNLANFVDDDGESTDPSEYRVYQAALIDWGDGTITSGLVTANPDGSFSVASTHHYQADGNYQIHVLVRRNTFYAWQPTVIQPLQGGSTLALMADAMVATSTITADPDSDFGVTFYVDVIGTTSRPPNELTQISANPARLIFGSPAPGMIEAAILAANHIGENSSNAPALADAIPPVSASSGIAPGFSNSAISSPDSRAEQLASNISATDAWLESDLSGVPSD